MQCASWGSLEYANVIAGSPLAIPHPESPTAWEHGCDQLTCGISLIPSVTGPS